VAFNTPAEFSGCNPNGIRRLGYLDASIFEEPERVSIPSRSCMHGSFRKGGNHFNTFRDWLILGLIAFNGSAAGAAILSRGHW
jgi:hypothetical protein